MTDGRFYKALSEASSQVLVGNVSSITVLYVTKDGDMASAYDKEDTTNVLELIGALDALKSRILYESGLTTIGLEGGEYGDEEDD